MIDNTSPLAAGLPCDEAVRMLSDRVRLAGLTVVRTFDLQVARHAQTACPCPHHGTQGCDCQMVVLLIYKEDHRPVTLVAHGNNGQTWFSVVNTPQQRADPELESAIRRSLVACSPQMSADHGLPGSDISCSNMHKAG
jgi:hypothetical protein